MSPELYHVAAGLYRRGERIAPGGWGRLVQGLGPMHDPNWFRELAFEQVRRDHFGSRVSRLAAVFAFDSFEVAQAHQAALSESSPHHIYVVELDEAAPPPDRLDMAWVDSIRAYHAVDAALAAISAYWRGAITDHGTPELLSSGPLTIVRRANSLRDDDPTLGTAGESVTESVTDRDSEGVPNAEE